MSALLSSKPNTQVINVATKLAAEAHRQGDYLASNVAWALSAQARFGRPQVKEALIQVRVEQMPAIIQALRSEGRNLGTAWLAVQRYARPAGRKEVRR